MRVLLFFLPAFAALLMSNALVAQVKLQPSTYDFGNVEIASSLSAVYAYTNHSSKSVYLLKVEAPETVSYQRPSQPTAPGTTATFRIVFAPNEKGAFNESVKLYFSDAAEPRVVKLKGNLKILDRVADIDCPTFDGKTAGANVVMCNVNFTVIDTETKEVIPGADVAISQRGVRRFSVKTQANGSIPMTMTSDQYGFEVSAAGYNTLRSQYPINRTTRQVTFELRAPAVEILDTVTAVATNNNTQSDELSVAEYAYNNIVFLIDVSSSMNTADRMPLLKKSMSELAQRLREGDRVAIVTYADKAKVVRESKPVSDKNELQNIIEQLTPTGGTSANKGLATAHNVLVESLITNGNNQLVVATDGDFALKESDLKSFDNGTVNGQRVNICVVGFGDNKNALKSLKKTSQRFNARYIHIDKSEQATNALLDEVKKNSKR